MTNPNVVAVALDVTRGDDWSWSMVVTASGVPVDVSGRAYRAQIRSSPDAPSAVDVTVSLVAASSGTVAFAVPHATTSGLRPGVWWWDVEQTDEAGVVLTVAGGVVNVAADVTRSGL